MMQLGLIMQLHGACNHAYYAGIMLDAFCTPRAIMLEIMLA